MLEASYVVKSNREEKVVEIDPTKLGREAKHVTAVEHWCRLMKELPGNAQQTQFWSDNTSVMAVCTSACPSS